MRVLVVTNDSTVFKYEDAKAEEMFGGRLTEVRNLKNRISDVSDSDFSIISGEHGLIPGDRMIKRYVDVPDTLSGYLRAEEKTRFSDAISELTKSYDVTLIFVPKEVMRILMRNKLHGMIIAVTNTEFKEEFKRRGWYYLERKGARVGKENFQTIYEIISSFSVS